VQFVRRQRLGERLVSEPKRGRRVGAAAAETGRDRDPLLDPHAPARLETRAAGQRAERLAHERVVCEAVDPELGCLVELDPVDEVDPLEDGQDLMLLVVTQRADDEREVYLGRCGRSHRRATTRSKNSRFRSS
jgi:hypothetical protein